MRENVFILRNPSLISSQRSQYYRFRETSQRTERRGEHIRIKIKLKKKRRRGRRKKYKTGTNVAEQPDVCLEFYPGSEKWRERTQRDSNYVQYRPVPVHVTRSMAGGSKERKEETRRKEETKARKRLIEAIHFSDRSRLLPFDAALRLLRSIKESGESVGQARADKCESFMAPNGLVN